MKKLQNIGNRIIPVAFTAVIVLIWQLVSDNAGIPKFVLPSPADIGSAIFKILPELKMHTMTTIWEALSGLAISIGLSIVLAVVMDSILVVKKALYPVLIISQTIPIIALAPLFIIWFGFGMLPKILVVVLVCFFPIVISLTDGLASVDTDMLNLMKSMGAGKIQIFRHLKLPAACMSFFSGLRIAVTYSIMGAVIGEWLGGEKGLGVYMIRVKHSYSLDKFFAVIVVIVILSIILFKITALIEYALMPWNRAQK